MLTEFTESLFRWIELHPVLAYGAVFLTAAIESLAVVGLFLPGTVLMFGIGALIATGALEFWPTFILSVLGAVAGDGVSFWLGRHFHQRLRVVWPFRRYPRMVNRGVDFFHKHGGKSVLFARFVGPVRPILPAIAGMLKMSPSRFLAVNFFSALLWAPAYLLPGIVFGASLGLAAEVAGRLAVLMMILLALLWFGFWVVVRALRFLQPHATDLMNRFLHWSRNHPTIRPLAGSLLDPDHPEARGLAVLAGLLGIAAVVFGITLNLVVQATPLTGIDRNLHELIQGLRNPWADNAMIGITELGDSLVLALVMLVVLVWLLWRRHWKAAAHWFAAYASVGILTHLLKATTKVPRPFPYNDGNDYTSFPSAHTSISLTLFGFLAVLAARELPPTRRWIPYTLTATLVIPIAFSRLYLGAHWPTDILGGATLGLIGVALFGIAYSRHPAERLSPVALALITVTGLVVIGSWHIGNRFTHDQQRYAIREEFATMSMVSWWEGGWRELPAYRIDVRDSHNFPLNVQYAGKLETLRAGLEAAGWHQPTRLTTKSALLMLQPEPATDELPVLPQLHDGTYDAFLMVNQFRHPDCYCTLRLWPGHLMLTDPETVVWAGLVSRLKVVEPLGLLEVLITDTDFDTPAELLSTALESGFEIKIQPRMAKNLVQKKAGFKWNGEVVLVRSEE